MRDALPEWGPRRILIIHVNRVQIVCRRRVRLNAFPAVDLPSLTVETRWNGASPKAIQRSITLPVEEAARNVHGVESITSRSLA